MAEDIKLGWLEDYDEVKFAPKTFSEQILNADGTSYEVSVQNKIDAINTQISNIQGGTVIAGAADKLDVADTGDATTPVYFKDGIPVECTSLDLNTSGFAAKTYFSASQTAADTAAKIAPITSGTFPTLLTEGLRVTVWFQYANNATKPTLKVGNSAAKSIYPANITWEAEQTLDFVYDGRDWSVVEAHKAATATNATTANALATAGTIQIDLTSDNAVTYTDGGDITPGVTGVLDAANGGTNNTTGRVQIGQKEGETLGTNATSEGDDTIASGNYSHAEGRYTKASGNASHAEGGQPDESTSVNNMILPDGTHIQMSITEASGDSSHAEGYPTRADGKCAHSEGSATLAHGNYSHSEGYLTVAFENYSHSEGYNTAASNKAAHAEGWHTTASGEESHAEGSNTTASGSGAHAEGWQTTASGDAAHAEGYNTDAQGDYAHSEGHNTRALNSHSHAEGMATIANGIGAHAEGSCHTDFITGLQQYNTENQTSITLDSNDDDLILVWNSSVMQRESSLAQGIASHVEGCGGLALGEYSHVEGQSNLAKGDSSHAEGVYTEASGDFSHAEGLRTIASGQCSHAQGTDTMAIGQNSIAAGEMVIAQGNNSVAIGENIFASGQNACALGQGATQTIYLSGPANTTQYTLTKLSTLDSYETLSNMRINSDGSITSSPPLSGTQQVSSSSTAPPRGTTYGNQYNYNSVIYELTPGNKYLFNASGWQDEIYLFSSYNGSTFSGALTLPDNSIIDRTSTSESIFLVAPLRVHRWVYRYNGYTQTDSTTYMHSYVPMAMETTYSRIYVVHFVEDTTSLQLPSYIKDNNNFVKVESQSGSSITLSDTLSAVEISNVECTLINDSVPGSNSFAIGCNTIAEGNNQLVCGIYNITDSSSLFIVGNGTSSTSKSNAMSVSQTGEITASKVYGAVWNDYAEYRTQKEIIEPGYCVASADNGQVYKTTEKFQACDGIVSDTFGFAIGETNECQTPLAVAGRVLAYCEGNRYNYHAGDTVCAGPEGKVCKMTREEIREWPDRIIGIVSEIPEYENWGTGNINVNGRIWIKVK